MSDKMRHAPLAQEINGVICLEILEMILPLSLQALI